MEVPSSRHRPRSRFVALLPDLITESDYSAPPEEKKIRVRISLKNDGIEVLGDSMHAPLLEKLFGDLGADEVDRMACG